jgi:hypothetical protein
MSIFPSKVNYTTGEVLTATEMNEIGQAINLLEGAQFAAGKNKIINGDFGVWQRGTSFSTSGAYTADRWVAAADSTFTASQQTFTPGTAPVAGYEGQFFERMAKNAGGTYAGLSQRIEDVRTLANQTVTVSLWAKADAAETIFASPAQNFGSGGSTQVNITAQSAALTTSWARYSFTFTFPSISGKTIGTSSFVNMDFYFLDTGARTFDIWGVQVEAAQTASNFQTATGTKQGELAACQRYYYQWVSGAVDTTAPVIRYGTTQGSIPIPLPVTMRTTPALVATASGGNFGRIVGLDTAFGVTVSNVTNLTPDNLFNNQYYGLIYTSGSVSGTYVFCHFDTSGIASNIGFSAEL